MTMFSSGLALGCAAAFALSACSKVPDVCLMSDAEFKKKIETKSVVTGYDQQLIGQVIMLSPKMKTVKRGDDEMQKLIQERNNICSFASLKKQ